MVQRGLLASSAVVLGRTCCSDGRQRPLLGEQSFSISLNLAVPAFECSFPLVMGEMSRADGGVGRASGLICTFCEGPRV